MGIFLVRFFFDILDDVKIFNAIALFINMVVIQVLIKNENNIKKIVYEKLAYYPLIMFCSRA